MLSAKAGFFHVASKYASLRTGLVAFWQLNEAVASGNTNATDWTGMGNTLTATNAPLSATGMVANGRNFVSASSQYLSANSSTDLQFGNGNWSISVWVKNTSNYSGSSALFQHVVGKDASTGREFGLRTQITNTGLNGYTASVFHTDGSELAVQFPGFANKNSFTGTWNHLAVTHNSGTVTAYFNYSQTSTGSRGASKTFAATSTQFNIGRRSYSGFNEYLDGVVDEVAKWNRALSASEVQAIYNGGAGLDITG
jgi:hypothetical protein